MEKGEAMSVKDRYRMMTDILDDQGDLISMADRKARFGVLILGGFNAILIFGSPALFERIVGLPVSVQGVIALVALAYILTALHFFTLAIDSIRPRIHKLAPDEKPTGFRFYQDITHYKHEDYDCLLRSVDYDRLFHELTSQIVTTAQVISKKYEALDRLFRGMRYLTYAAGVMLVAGFWLATQR